MNEEFELTHHHLTEDPIIENRRLKFNHLKPGTIYDPDINFSLTHPGKKDKKNPFTLATSKYGKEKNKIILKSENKKMGNKNFDNKTFLGNLEKNNQADNGEKVNKVLNADKKHKKGWKNKKFYQPKYDK